LAQILAVLAAMMQNETPRPCRLTGSVAHRSKPSHLHGRCRRVLGRFRTTRMPLTSRRTWRRGGELNSP